MKIAFRTKFLLIVAAVASASSAIAATSATTQTFQNGIMLDCARKSCTVEMVKSYVDIIGEPSAISKSANSESTGFLTLHLSDNEGVADFSAAEIASIREYAASKNVSIIPEVDMPAHMGGFFKQAREKYGNAFTEIIAVNEAEVPGELNVTEPAAIDFAEQILARYMEMFKPNAVQPSPTQSSAKPIFSIGADEFWTDYDIRTIQFINHMDSILTANGFVTRIYNDLILKEYIHDLDKDIQVVYWAHDGATSDAATRQERIAKRASLPELQAAGFKIIETNSYYLYFIPSERNTNQHDLDYTVNDIANWNLSRWDGNHEGGLKNYDNIIGAEIAVWREESAGVADSVVLNQARRMFEAMKASIASDIQKPTAIFNKIPTERSSVGSENKAYPAFNKKSSSIEILLKDKSYSAMGQKKN